MTALLSALLMLGGAVLLYLASPNQRLAARPFPRAAGWAGAVALIAALVPLLGSFGPATAVFVWMTGAMLVWSVLPLAAAWWRGVPENRK